MLRFQSTRPHGARRGADFGAIGSSFGFNPRARTGRDPAVTLYPSFLVDVSIHAPARGATRISIAPRSASRSFNPRARTGRDLALSPRRSYAWSFNPRARTGRDMMLAGVSADEDVSIHAPARGATGIHNYLQQPHGGFQSTRPHGARRGWLGGCGGDPGVSIHAPARGATKVEVPACIRAMVSIHAPARGATLFFARASSASCRFNPRARTGRDKVEVPACIRAMVSIHAPARGAT